MEPEDAARFDTLARGCLAAGDLAGAVAHWRRAVVLDPEDIDRRYNLARALTDLGRHPEAEQAYREAIARVPDHGEALFNLANLLVRRGAADQAIPLYRRAVAACPASAAFQVNLGMALKAVGRLEEAERAYREAIRLDPGRADAHWNLAILLLSRGRWQEGFAEYQWRLKRFETPALARLRPGWDGALAPERHLLLWAEQGVGDAIHFLRYAVVAARRVGGITVCCHAGLVSLARKVAGVDRAVPFGTPLPDFDLQAPLMSLPHLLQMTDPAASWHGPYLPLPSVPKTGGSAGCKRVGLVWSGNPQHLDDRRRSCPPQLLRPLTAISGIRLYSLQKGKAAEAAGREAVGDRMIDLAPRLNDFAATAAAIAGLDLVVTVDTAVAHLAGAMGKPVWLLLPQSPDWRWQLSGQATPWYPSMRIFRQPAPGDWPEVVGQVIRALGKEPVAAPSGSSTDRVEVLNRLGVLAGQSGDWAAAAGHLEQAARLVPENGMVWDNLGNALKALGKSDRAEACYRRALALDPANPDPPFNLAVLFHEQGRTDEALDWYLRTLEVNPDDPGALNNLASLYRTRGDAAAAEAAYRRLLKIKPDHLRALVNLAGLLGEQKRHDEALACCRRASESAPEDLIVLLCLGSACRNAGRLEEARQICAHAVALHPHSVQAHFNSGNVFKDLGRYAEAGDCYRRALAIDGKFAPAWCNLGSVHREDGQSSDAMACYEKALSIDPDYAEVHNNLSIVHTEAGRIGQALECCRKAQSLRPDFAQSYNNMARTLKYAGRAAESLAWYQKALDLSPQTAFVHSNLLYCLCYLPETVVTPQAVSLAHRRWDKIHGARPGRIFSSLPGDRDPNRPLRVGYVSPDFRQHPVATFMTPVLANHDPAAVETFCFSDVRGGDRVTERLRGLAGQWVPIAGLCDDRVAEEIRRRRIDILVDLAGHTAGNRMPLFTRRPAPIQVTYLGYPASTGLAAIDYRLSDAWADPPGMTEAFHSETLVRLPRGFLCYEPPPAAPAVGPSPGLAEGRITFGSFNNLAKFNPDVADVWSAILDRVPGSRLMMKFRTLADPGVQDHVRGLFAARGIAPERLILKGFLPTFKDHFALYHKVDIALDPFPYNGTTTTCEALWMGVPVIVLAGSCHAARVGVSILTGLGLEELVAQNRQDYIARAAALAADSDRLTALRASLRPRMQQAPLTDGPGFARSLESAYREMWRRRCAAGI